VQQYWFDLNRQVLAPEFGKPFASMVFGGKYAYNTWWTQEPRQILGINLLPFTPASTYLGADPAFIRKIMAALPGEVKNYEKNGATTARPLTSGRRPRFFFALADPDAALALWNRRGSVEFGDTRTRTLYWVHSLQEMGLPDFTVTADTPLYAVFKDKSGAPTYLAYNARDTATRVTFSTARPWMSRHAPWCGAAEVLETGGQAPARLAIGECESRTCRRAACRRSETTRAAGA